MKGFRYKIKDPIKLAPKQTQLWARTQYLHGNSARNSSRQSSLSRPVHYGLAVKPGPSSALHALFCLSMMTIRKKRWKKNRKTGHLTVMLETKCVNKCLHSRVTGASRPLLCVHTDGHVHAHAHTGPLLHRCLYYKRFSQHHHIQCVIRPRKDLIYIKCFGGTGNQSRSFHTPSIS